MVMRFRSYSVLPGFAPTLGFSLLYLGILVLLPISALVLYSVVNLSSQEFWQVVSQPRVVASFKLSFTASLIAALLNSLFGLIIAWVLVRQSFPGRRLGDTLLDLLCPALPCAPSSPPMAGLAAWWRPMA